MDPLLSAHELSALLLIGQPVSDANLGRSEIEQLINRRLVERAAGASGAPQLKLTMNGNAMLAKICNFETQSITTHQPKLASSLQQVRAEPGNLHAKRCGVT